jgi:type II secretory pathway predicted ATPase ExeA
LLETIDHQRLNAIKLVSTAIEADDLLRICATHLNVDAAGLSKAELLVAIERGLHAVARTGRRTLLVVDEAQALPVSAVEELRMLSNFQAGGHALLQILLLGQPEFRDRLHGLEQLRQRIIAIHHLDPMGEHEVEDYIAHRLSVVGWTGRPDFADDAFTAFYEGSGGVPRRLNLLAGRVMLHAALTDLDLIDGATVRQVIADLAADLPAPVIPSVATPVVVAEPAVERSDPVHPDPTVDARITALEDRIEQQDAALRRVLTLLVDWIEAEDPHRVVAPESYVPNRTVTAWTDAA